jgi:hypothetical protein
LLQEHIDKNRLGQWWVEAQRAARREIEAEQREMVEAMQQYELMEENGEAVQAVEGAHAEEMEVQDGGEEEGDADVESVGDTEQEQEQDTEMGDA